MQIKWNINTNESTAESCVFLNIVAVTFPTDTLTKSGEFEEKWNKKLEYICIVGNLRITMAKTRV